MQFLKQETIMNKILKLYESSKINLDKSRFYSVMIGNDILRQLPNKIKKFVQKLKKLRL